MSKDIAFNQVKKHPEDFKKALKLLNDEVMLYKDGIVDGSISLTPEAIMRFQEAIKDLSDTSSVTLVDLGFHTDRLQQIRLQLTPSTKGGDADGTANN